MGTADIEDGHAVTRLDPKERNSEPLPSAILAPPIAISVAMATYNGAAFLEEQLDSIAKQTLLPVELVIRDDASTDNTRAVVEKFAESAPFPVNFHRHSQRLGYARNFRSAACCCGGELIAFCDQDDWWLPTRLETCASKFANPDVLLLYHNATVVNEGRHKIGKLYDQAAEQRALDLKPVGPWNHSYGLVQIFRSKLRKYDDLWDQSLNHITEPMDILSHDQWYFFLAEALGRVEFFDDELVEYRQHSRNNVGACRMRSSVATRLFARAAHHGNQDLRQSKAATARARILREIARREPSCAARLNVSADCYNILARRTHRRYETYSRHGLSRRLGSLISAWMGGDYSDWPWGFDKRSVARDFWSGVLLANR